MSVGLVVVAAGNGTRMGSPIRKPYLYIGEMPILILTLQKFLSISSITEMVLVVHPTEIERTHRLLEEYKMTKIRLAIGGEERQDSVVAGVAALSDHVEYVLIHDGARPFVSPSLIERILIEVKQKGAVIPAVPVKDTIKVVNELGEISYTPDRRSLWAAQTPQAFSLSTLRTALQQAREKGMRGTDDASILEMLGYPVYITIGEWTNMKITTPEDLLLGEAILRMMEGER
jgi:2-C-methyl-D-erythritol 4-phosphate cytidylyltransferase